MSVRLALTRDLVVVAFFGSTLALLADTSLSLGAVLGQAACVALLGAAIACCAPAPGPDAVAEAPRGSLLFAGMLATALCSAIAGVALVHLGDATIAVSPVSGPRALVLPASALLPWIPWVYAGWLRRRSEGRPTVTLVLAGIVAAPLLLPTVALALGLCSG